MQYCHVCLQNINLITFTFLSQRQFDLYSSGHWSKEPLADTNTEQGPPNTYVHNKLGQQNGEANLPICFNDM